MEASEVMQAATAPRGVSHAESALVRALAGTLIVIPLLPRIGIWLGAAAMLGTLGFAWHRRMRAATHLSLYFGLFLALALLRLPLSQLTFGLALLGYGCVVHQVGWLGGVPSWIGRGKLRAVDVWTAVGFTVVAGVCLWVWYVTLRPNLDDLLAAFVPDVSLGVLLAGAVVCACINAAVEEAAYRGVLYESVQPAFPGWQLALYVQAAAFGTMHIQGFPRGTVGVILATIYGLMMGWLRLRSGGFLLPWLAHTVTDLVIALILILLVRQA